MVISVMLFKLKYPSFHSDTFFLEKHSIETEIQEILKYMVTRSDNFFNSCRSHDRIVILVKITFLIT